ncbi:MAG: hypothetical protein K2X57_27250 [Xanthobacteraceae bacterium]|nr:hypothetical protein [Xanthobacteraceae bacterium]MBY0611653.1 hypothetical protein [Beijerinckiaceae bacterium]
MVSAILLAETDPLLTMAHQRTDRSGQAAFARLFNPAHEATSTAPVFTISRLGGKWWVFYRSDGRSGGIFDSKDGALLQARLDSRTIQIAIVEIIDPNEAPSRTVYVRGAVAGATDEPLLKLVS